MGLFNVIEMSPFVASGWPETCARKVKNAVFSQSHLASQYSRALIQVIIFVVLCTRGANVDGQTRIRQLIHPNPICNRHRSTHRAAVVPGFGGECGLSAKLPSRVYETIECSLGVEYKDNAEFIDTHSESG